MKLIRKIIFYGFITATVLVAVFAFWLFSRQPSEAQLVKAFPDNSYNVFQEGEELVLYSIVPNKNIASSEKFRGYSTLGKTKIQKGGFTSFLKHAFINDVANTFGGGAAGFNPRHGMRISKGTEIVDLVICFECGNFVSFYNEKSGEGDIYGNYQIIFDKVLEDANIALAK